MNRDPGNDLIRVFILGKTERREGKGKEGGRNARRVLQDATICDTLLYNAGERHALSAPQSPSSKGEKRAAEILYGTRAERGGPLAARSHTRTLPRGLALLLSSFPFVFSSSGSRKSERKRTGRSLFSLLPGHSRNERQRFLLMPRDRLPIALAFASNVTCHDS